METELLTKLAGLLGLAGVMIGVFFLLYRQVIALPIFDNVGPVGTVMIIVLALALIWALAVIIVIGPDAFTIIFGNNNQVNSGLQS